MSDCLWCVVNDICDESECSCSECKNYISVNDNSIGKILYTKYHKEYVQKLEELNKSWKELFDEYRAAGNA